MQYCTLHFAQVLQCTVQTTFIYLFLAFDYRYVIQEQELCIFCVNNGVNKHLYDSTVAVIS